MPKLSAEKLNPGHDAAVRRMLGAWSRGRESVNGERTDKPAAKPSKDERPQLKAPSSQSLARQ